jgi:2'-5' RNA ligase
VRWVDADTFHITLKFLGEVPEQRLKEMTSALEQAASVASGFTFALRGAGAFPNFRRPRVFWIGTVNAEPLLILQEAVEQFFEPLGFPTEKRAYHPHLTLGRAGVPLNTREAKAAERAASALEYEKKVTVETVDLMLSRLSPKGARYEAIHSVPLV